MGPHMGVKISKCYSYKFQSKFWNLSWIFHSLHGPQKITFGIFEILSFRFLTIFFFQKFHFPIVTYGEIKNLNCLENERS